MTGHDDAPVGGRKDQPVTAGVTFIGAGPGAADLLTLRGAAAINAADLIIWASSLVHPDVLRHARDGAEVVDSAKLSMEGVLVHYERAAREGGEPYRSSSTAARRLGCGPRWCLESPASPRPLRGSAGS